MRLSGQTKALVTNLSLCALLSYPPPLECSIKCAFCETSGLFCFPMGPYGGFRGLKANLARLPNLHYKVFIMVAAMSGLNPSMLSIIHDLNGMLNLSLIILVNHRIFLGKVDCGANLV